jgi:hypothetical protein
MTLSQQLHKSATHKAGADPSCPVCTPTIPVELTHSEWNTVTAALLCLRDHDENRGCLVAASEDASVYKKVSQQLGRFRV